MSESGNAVGWSYDDNCNPDALYWDIASTGTYVNLGGFMPQGSIGDHTKAEAVNDAMITTVVGWNATQSHAWRWIETSPGTWTSADLNTLIPQCFDIDPLYHAWDVNDAGWILAWGDADPQVGGTDFHAYLLIPWADDQGQNDCPADIAAGGVSGVVCYDGLVNSDDLFDLQGAWGPCTGCAADLTGDDEVDADDLFVLLGSWGVCHGGVASFELDACTGHLAGPGAQGGESLPGAQSAEAPFYSLDVVLLMYGFTNWDDCARWLNTEATPAERETFIVSVNQAMP